MCSNQDNEELVEVGMYEEDPYDTNYYTQESISGFLAHMHIGSMGPKPLQEPRDTDTPGENKIKKYKVTLQADKTACEQPINSQDEKRCLATYVNIRGHEAWTLWDLGSTTSGITPVFAQVADIPVFPLTNTHTPQLGMIGS